MAASISSFRLPTVASAALPHPVKPDPSRRSNNWWAPILGWSAEPDYITTRSSDPSADSDPGRASADKSLFRGCFTEQKAKEHPTYAHNTLSFSLSLSLSLSLSKNLLVYKVTVPDGEALAVKKMWSSEETGTAAVSSPERRREGPTTSASSPAYTDGRAATESAAAAVLLACFAHL